MVERRTPSILILFICFAGLTTLTQDDKQRIRLDIDWLTKDIYWWNTDAIWRFRSDNKSVTEVQIYKYDTVQKYLSWSISSAFDFLNG